MMIKYQQQSTVVTLPRSSTTCRGSDNGALVPVHLNANAMTIDDERLRGFLEHMNRLRHVLEQSAHLLSQDDRRGIFDECQQYIRQNGDLLDAPTIVRILVHQCFSSARQRRRLLSYWHRMPPYPVQHLVDLHTHFIDDLLFAPLQLRCDDVCVSLFRADTLSLPYTMFFDLCQINLLFYLSSAPHASSFRQSSELLKCGWRHDNQLEGWVPRQHLFIEYCYMVFEKENGWLIDTLDTAIQRLHLQTNDAFLGQCFVLFQQADRWRAFDAVFHSWRTADLSWHHHGGAAA